MKRLQIRDVRWLNPELNHDQTGHLLIDNGTVSAITELRPDVPVLNGQDLWLMPGMYDLGHHLAAPGPIQDASLDSELSAAWRNGFSRVCAWPDTQPVIDSGAVIEGITRRITCKPAAALSWLGALTQNLAGKQLSNMAALRDAGCLGYSQAGAALPAPDVLRLCLRYAADLDMSVHLSPRFAELSDGCAHDGAVATRLGLAGIPTASETVAVGIILALVEDTGCRVHISRLSSGAAAQMIADGQQRGLPVSADVSIWHLLHTEEALSDYDVQFHLSPPLRTEADRLALLAHVQAGTITAIASGHHPHGHDAKFGPFPETQTGASSVDGYLAQLLELVQVGALTPLQIAARSSLGPATVLGAPAGDANWLLIDPTHAWTLDANSMHSAAMNTPLLNAELRGCAAGWIGLEQIELYEHWHARLGV